MKKPHVPRFQWIANMLRRIADWLERERNSDAARSRFVDLAPTDQADKDGVYSEALLYALKNEKITNIALTGPYGSGKSSIITSFLKNNKVDALHISLAAFAPGQRTASNEVERKDIEISILQQMLYGADANKLPLSRFKRIQSPSILSVIKSLCIAVGVPVTWYVISKREAIISGEFLVPLSLSNWLNFTTLTVASLFVWWAVYHLYVASLGLSLKSISLKDIEITPANDELASVLNRHLDEIIYFFQSTSYVLVVIEDLDRFDDSEIFVTLRELNGLINENAGVKRTIRFLYALRDDMFVSTDRTKFFEFIIPVVPIINASNSIDMVLAHGQRLNLGSRLERQFVREVSRYLNDLRLIQNIFNEYAVYESNLKTDEKSILDANKLLGVLIYKNVYPKDFEELHRGSGVLAKILSRHAEFVVRSESEYRSEIATIEQEIEDSERQTPLDLEELRRIYAMSLIERLPNNSRHITPDQQRWYHHSQLSKDGLIEQLHAAPRVICRLENGAQQAVDVSEWRSEMNSKPSYDQRRREIEERGADHRRKGLRRIRDLKLRIKNLRASKFNELLRLYSSDLQELFNEYEAGGDLARFLLLEGYIDDTYYQYTSLFHSGRLSPNDNSFLIQIRSFQTPEPSFAIDNPKEVIAAMRNEDFRQSYVLNVRLVDCLLSSDNDYDDQKNKFFEFVSNEFENCESFLDAYYTVGQDVAGLLSELDNAWQGLVPAFISSPNSTTHIARLIESIPELSLKCLAGQFEELPRFVSENLSEILEIVPGLEPARLSCLNFEVRILREIGNYHEIVREMFERGLYEVNVSNVEFVYESFLGGKDVKALRERNFTTILAMGDSALMERIDLNFDKYVRGVLLGLDRNTQEDASAIMSVVCNDSVSEEELLVFLEKQVVRLPVLDEVPERLHPMFLRSNLIESSWENCICFLDSGSFEEDILLEYLDRNSVRKNLLKHPMPDDSDSLILGQFLVGADGLSDEAYRQYVHALPKIFTVPPKDVSRVKLEILIDEGKIEFTAKALALLSEHPELQVLFVSRNVDLYLAEPGEFLVDDGFRMRLLEKDISLASKIGLIELIDLSQIDSHPEDAVLIGSVVAQSDAAVDGIDGRIAEALIIHSTEVSTQVNLFNRFNALFDVDQVRSILARLPSPFCEIKNGFNTPKLDNTPENQALVIWLKDRGIISSWSETGYFEKRLKVNLFRR